MMNDKRTMHTAGPWRVGCDGWCLWRADYDGEAGVTSHQTISSVAGETVCLIVGIGGDETEFDANARLIAAAPAMLEALHKAREWLEGWGSAEHQLGVINAAIAAASVQS